MTGVIPPLYMLLLPSLARFDLREEVYSAYRTPLEAVLEQLAYRSRWATAGAVLDIAVQLPSNLYDNNPLPDSLYHHVQSLLSSLYKLICVIATEKDINVEDDEGIDARIVLLRSTPHSDSADHPGLSERFGPVISLNMLASSKRGWQEVFSVESEPGEELLRQFLTSQDDHMKVGKVKAGSASGQESPANTQASSAAESSPVHTSIAVGGTWDHVHLGHKLLLTLFAFLLGKSDGAPTGSLTVGTTGDSLLKNKKYSEYLQSWHDRQASASKFLEGILDFRSPDSKKISVDELQNPGPNGHAIHVCYGQSIVIKFVELWDAFGPTIEDKGISALVISAETRSGGKAVNDKRAEKDWPLLQVYEVDVLDSKGAEQEAEEATDYQWKLSSTAIRQALSNKAKARVSS